MSGYREKDAAHDTRVTEREATAAWHQARDDSSVRSEGGGDRPTAQNYVDASRRFDEVMTRARERADRERVLRGHRPDRADRTSHDRTDDPGRDRSPDSDPGRDR